MNLGWLHCYGLTKAAAPFCVVLLVCGYSGNTSADLASTSRKREKQDCFFTSGLSRANTVMLANSALASVPMLRSAIVLAILLSLPVSSADGDGIGPLPSAIAVGVEHEGRVLVTWSSTEIGADGYRIYGRTGTDRILLASVAGETHAEVEAGYSYYELTTVTGDTESDPIEVIPAKGPCIALYLRWPFIVIGCLASNPNLESTLPQAR